MSLLLANIGTSDLAIRFTGPEGQNYYLPIDFLSEPNLSQELNTLPADLQKIWNDQKTIIDEFFYTELGFSKSVKRNSRCLTAKLLEHYCLAPSKWHHRLAFVRILGVLQKAAAIQPPVSKAYIFITNQTTRQNRNGHDKDTIYLVRLLQNWLRYDSRQPQPQFANFPKLVPVRISSADNPSDLEVMLRVYEQAIDNIIKTEQLSPSSDIVLVSIKGGTPQMGTALQLQAIDSGLNNIIFVDPQLSLHSVLQGQPSQCKLTLYWRHLRSHKYRSIRRLLERWDFDGAISILEDWQNSVSLLPVEVRSLVNLSELETSSNLAINALKVGLCLFNFDRQGAEMILHNSPSELSSLSHLTQTYQSWLNLYAHCQIYWQLNQVANFLWCLSSFWEDVVNYLVIALGGRRYFLPENTTGILERWNLVDPSQIEPDIWDCLTEHDDNLKKHDFSQGKKFSLNMRRFTKRYLAEAIVRHNQGNIQEWEKIEQALKQLNYWVEKRNDLIHRIKGASQQSMHEMLAADRKLNMKEAQKASDVDSILETMQTLCLSVFRLLEQSPYPGIDSNLNGPCYLYSDIVDWVKQQLDE
ncbi:hypothetical protein [Laspinema olomoucense]|uniref:hypothetical protein n=1 Tax=Laspinema olomoucense TaxID=3231600 RepID=UPI0021BB909D|nr:hypothetical protein [Laspinema sp. D3d]MCT7973450.1 hypothetical protein [Laspinema sp. D3d]